MKPTLLILAAGMGSRYGSLKQIDAIGPSGETIIDYSVYDAIRAGFGKVVFVIRKNIEKDFKEVFGNRFQNKIKVEYVFQELENLPEGFQLPPEREKPWGTAHAVLMAKDKINEPFAVINADDFYGADAFQKLADFFSQTDMNENIYSMVGYTLNKTLSDHGFVSRGVCETDSEGNLITVVERTKIEKLNGKILFSEGDAKIELQGNEKVSMNFWGFMPSFFNYTERDFIAFLKESIHIPKSEFFIPLVVNNLIQSKTIKLKVLPTSASWFGVTYKEDKPVVIQKIRDLIARGVYPAKLWKI